MTKKNKFFAVSASAALVASAIVPVAASAAVADFNDKDQIADYALPFVEYLVDNEVMSGKGNGTFDPKGNVTRAEAAKMFTVAFDLTATGEKSFPDVKEGKWYTEFVLAAADQGIVTGFDNGTFAPDVKITRAQAATMIARVLGEAPVANPDLSQFADGASVPAWAAGYVALAVDKGIMKGRQAGEQLFLDWNNNVSRQDFAVMFQRTGVVAEMYEAVDTVQPPVVNEELVAAVEAMNAAEFGVSEIELTEETIAELKAAIAELEAAIADVEAFEATEEDVVAAVVSAKETATDAKAAIEALEAELAEAALVQIEEVVAINETTIEVTLEEGVKEADLVDAKLTVTDAEGKALTATYSEKSLDKDGNATFTLATGEKLVDAAKYAVAGEGFKGAEFVAKVATAYVADFVKVTTSLPASLKDDNKQVIPTTIAVAGLNQYGEEQSITELKDVKIEGTVNDMPLDNAISYNAGVVTIDKTVELKEGDKVAFTLTYKVSDKVTTKSTIEYTVAKAEASKVTSIEITAKDNKVSVPSGEKVELTAKAFDQFKSPATDAQLKWVVNGKTVTATNGKYILNETTPGEYKVQVFSVADSKIKAEMTVTVGAAELKTLTFTNTVANVEDVQVTANAERFNNEEMILGTLTQNTGAALTVDNIKFNVVPGKDLKASDITVSAVEMTDEDDKKVIVVKATTTKAGEFKVTPFVGESFTAEKVVKSSQITVKSEVNTEVKAISNVTFDAKELKVGQDIYKEITFTNKHGEVLNADQVVRELKSSNESVLASNKVTVVAGDKSIAGQDENKTYLKISDAKKGTTVVTLAANAEGNVVKTYTLVFSAAQLNKVTVDTNKVTGVVAGDAADKAKYNAVTFLDQDGVKMTDVTTANVDVEVKNAKGEVVDNKELVTLGEVTKNEINKKGEITGLKDGGTKATHVQVLPTSKLEQGTYTVTLSSKVTDEKGKVQTLSTTFQVVVEGAREVKTIDLSTKVEKVAVGGTTEIMINVEDQYEEFFAAGVDAFDVKSSSVAASVGQVTEVTAGQLDKTLTGAEAAKVVAYKVVVAGEAKGSANISVSVKGKEGKVVATASQAIAVDNASALIDSIEIKEVAGLLNGNTGVELKATVKDANNSEVNVEAGQLTWTVDSVKDANGNTLKVENNKVTLKDEKGADAGEATISITNGKMTVTSAKDVVLDVTVKVASKSLKSDVATFKVGTAKASYASDFAVAKINGSDEFETTAVTIESTEEAVIDAVEKAKVTYTFVGLDQYGKDFDILKDVTVATSSDADLDAKFVAGTEATDKAAAVAGTLTVTAKSAEGGKVYVSYKDANGKTAELVLDVKLSADVAKLFVAQVDTANAAVDTALEALANAKTVAQFDAAYAAITNALKDAKVTTSKKDEANQAVAESQAKYEEVKLTEAIAAYAKGLTVSYANKAISVAYDNAEFAAHAEVLANYFSDAKITVETAPANGEYKKGQVIYLSQFQKKLAGKASTQSTTTSFSVENELTAGYTFSVQPVLTNAADVTKATSIIAIDEAVEVK